MKFICFTFLLMVSATVAFSQNYYVAVVKGEVYYKNKLLRKRDKIKMHGNLRFSTAGDYVKLSGSGGLFTIRPGADPNSGNEFLVAVKEELFPKIRPLATVSQNIVMELVNSNYFGQKGVSRTFFKKNHLDTTVPTLKDGEEIGFLHETSLGLVYKTASIENGLLVIQQSDFTLRRVNGQTPTLQQTAIVKVTDKKRWQAIFQDKDSLSYLDGLVAYFGMDYIPSVVVPNSPPTGEEEMVQETFPAEILDYMPPPRFIRKKDLVKDLRFHLRQSGAADIETFMDNYEYEGYIWETYGNVFHLNDILRKDLGLISKYDDIRE